MMDTYRFGTSQAMCRLLFVFFVFFVFLRNSKQVLLSAFVPTSTGYRNDGKFKIIHQCFKLEVGETEIKLPCFRKEHLDN